METPHFLLYLVLILLSARLFGELAAYCNIPSVIGELAAGLILGPSVLAIVPLNEPIQFLAEMGIILLLFEVGLETDVAKLAASGKKACMVALLGVILPFVFGYTIGFYLFHFSTLVSLFIGSALTATSIGITVRVLKDLGKQNSHEAQIVLAAAVLDDIIGVIILAILFEFSISHEVNLLQAAKVLFLIVLYLLLSPILVKGLAQCINKWDSKSEIPGILPCSIVSLILFFAWLAHLFGAPQLLGGFAAGLALSKRFSIRVFHFLRQSLDFTDRVEMQMQPIIHLFTPIFFVSIGLSLDLKVVEWGSSFIWLVTGSLFVAAIIGKLLSGFILPKESKYSKFLIGTSMIPRGEVGLVFANIGLTSGVFTSDVFAAVLLVIAFTTLCAPIVLRSLSTVNSN